MTYTKKISKILPLMRNTENIRNVGILAHIDHGKCIAGDTRIYFSDGTISRADTFFDQTSPRCSLLKETNEKVIYDCSNLDLKIFTLNKETGSIETHPLKYLWKLRGGPLLKVKLRTGFVISTTTEHKFLVFNGVDFIEKRADELKIGNRIICARKLTVTPDIDLKELFLKKIGEKSGFYVILKKDFSENISNFIHTYGIEKLVMKISLPSKKSFINELNKNRFRLEDIIKICYLFSIRLSALYDGVEFISFRSGKNVITDSQALCRGKKSTKLRLPRSFENFFYFAGLMLGDGINNKYIVGKPELNNRFERICVDMGLKPYLRKYNDKYPELYSEGGITFLIMLNRLFDYPLKRNSHNKRISDFVFKTPNHYVSSFIKGYFDCNGTVELSHSAISITSVSQRMLRDLQLLLLRFGCISELHGDTLYLSGSSAKKYLENIGFKLKEKKQKLIELCKKSKICQIIDLIPIDGEVFRDLQSDIPKAQIRHHLYKYENEDYIPTRYTTYQLLTKLKKKSDNINQVQKLFSSDIAYIEIVSITEDFAEYVYDFTVESYHNFVAEGMIIHNTTLSDNLLAYCGLLSPSLAGEARALDFLEEEQKRGITIKTANISLPYQSGTQLYIINLIDTPGHVDFSGARDQSLRVIDGAIIVVDAVEGCMVQTEIVTKQALEEHIKPLLFINKIDRLITELKLSLKEIEKRLNDIIQNFNNFIELYASNSFIDSWRIDVKKGNIAFGSALHLWGCTAEEMLKQNIKFKDILKLYQNGYSTKEFANFQKFLPLSKSIFEMIIKHLPNPYQAQKYRIPNLWFGDSSSDIGQNLLTCDPNGAFFLYIYKNISDINLGVISLGRIFSGTVHIGKKIYSLMTGKYNKIQQLFLLMGAHRERIKSMSAGNIVALNFKNSKIGDTLVEEDYEDTIPFEKIKYESEAVVQYSIEPLHPRELKKMLNLLEQISINDPNLEIITNEETGEILISGLGELHLEIITNELKKQGIELIISDPIVTYRESIHEKTELIRIKSVDFQNSITIQVEPLESQVIELLTTGQVTFKMSRNRKKQILQKLANWDDTLIQKLIYLDTFGNIIFWLEENYNLEVKTDIPLILYHEIEKIFRFGPLIRFPIRGIKISILDLSLKSESIQLNFLQIIPLLKQAISKAFESSNAILLQPIYKIQIKTISPFIGIISSVIAQNNGKIFQIDQKSQNIFITGQIPVKGTFGLANKLRSKCSGNVFYQTFFSHWERILPESYMKELIQKLRNKRGI